MHWSLFWLVDLGGLVLGFLALKARCEVHERRREWPSDRRRGALRAFLTEALDLVVFGGIWAIVAAILVRFYGHGGFGLIRIWCHVAFCVLAPLAFWRAVVLWRSVSTSATDDSPDSARPSADRRGPRIAAVALGALALLAEGVYLWARHVEPFRLEVVRERVELEGWRGERLTVAILADLQTDRIGDWERRVLRELDDVRADLILLPGDLLQCRTMQDDQRERRKLGELFDSLSYEPPLGIFLVGGNTDPAGVGVPGARVRLLDDEAVDLTPTLKLIGLMFRSALQPFSPSDSRVAKEPGKATIVIGHTPDFALPIIENGAETPMLCVAGHTHGGQIVIPGFGPPLTLTRVPRRYARGGLHRFGKAWLRVSRGIGLERGSAPRIRLFCRPELVVLELVPRRILRRD